MTRHRRNLSGALGVLVIIAVCTSARPQDAHTPSKPAPPVPMLSELFVCGGTDLCIVDMNQSPSGEEIDGRPRTVWHWNAFKADDLPERMKPAFNNLDECKPVDGGTKLLITSKNGGVALIERKTSKVLFFARVPNAHSAVVVPGNRLVVVGAEAPAGNCVELYDLSHSDKRLWREPLEWGNGAVWDAKRQRVWALGRFELRAYALRDWDSDKPYLVQASRYRLPGDGGHDLVAHRDSSLMTITAHNNVWLFDREDGRFLPHPDLAGYHHLKSVSIHWQTGQFAVVEPEGDNWWASRIRLANPRGSVLLLGQRIYKARWNVVPAPPTTPEPSTKNAP